MALTDTLIKNTKPTEKTQKLFDGNGLYLEVTPRGSKRWSFNYCFMGKEKLWSVGLYPEISLKVARERRDDLRRKVAVGIDPSVQRKALKDAHLEKSANTFEAIGREWHLKFSSTDDFKGTFVVQCALKLAPPRFCKTWRVKNGKMGRD